MATKKEKKRGAVIKFFFTVLGKAFLVNLFILFFIGAGLKMHRFFTSSPYFAIQNVEVYGNKKLIADEIIKHGGNLKGKNIFLLNIKGLHDDLLSHPMIKEVFIEKIYPKKVNISVSERVPFAIMGEEGDFYLIDKEGIVLSKITTELSTYPHVTGINKTKVKISEKISNKFITVLVKIIKEFNSLYGNTEYTVNLNNMKSPEVFLRKINKRIVLAYDRIEEGVTNFSRLRYVFGDQLGKINAINLSFKDTAVITMKESN